MGPLLDRVFEFPMFPFPVYTTIFSLKAAGLPVGDNTTVHLNIAVPSPPVLLTRSVLTDLGLLTDFFCKSGLF